jgi:uncharacterized membrane protein
MFCSKCGAENPDGTKFCSKCGADLGTSVQPSVTPSEGDTGLSANTAGLLCYLAGWITGIIFLVIDKKRKFVRFHAWQSIMTFGVLMVASLILSPIPLIGWVLGPIIWVLGFVLWIILMVQAGTGKMWKLPLVGDWAEKQANKA